jgi:hypothetical protein
MTAPRAATAIYVYCITEGEPICAPAGLHPFRAIHSIVCENLVAMASRVPLEEFGQEVLSSHLADACWLEKEARGHEEVIEKVMQTRAVLPLKFCTIFRTEKRVTALLGSRREQFHRALAVVRGKQEWEVKLFAAPALPQVNAPQSEQQGASSGKEYLLSKATARLRASAMTCQTHHHAQRCFEEVAGCVEDIRLRPIDAESGLGQVGLIWDAACLLATSCVPSFCQRLEALGRQLSGKGLRLRASGPWPPYHFTEIGQDDVALSERA